MPDLPAPRHTHTHTHPHTLAHITHADTCMHPPLTAAGRGRNFHPELVNSTQH